MNHEKNNYARVQDLEADLDLEGCPEPRTPIVLLLDTSDSMSGEPLLEVNEAVRSFKKVLMNDALLRRRVEVTILTFGGTVELVQDFVTADALHPPTLIAKGGTLMGEGIRRALDCVDQRSKVLSVAGIPKTLPCVFLITDGAPTDDWQRAAARVHRSNAMREVAFFTVGVQGADMQTLKQIAAPERPPVKLANLKFQHLFSWGCPSSVKEISLPTPDAQVALPPPGDWAEVWGGCEAAKK